MTRELRVDTHINQRLLTQLSGPAIRRVIRNTINDMAFDGRAEEIQNMHQDLDRPTPFTASPRAFLIRKARNQNLTAVVELKRIQAAYLQWQIFGGVQRPGRYGFIPIGLGRRNQYGNTPAYRRLLSKRRSRPDLYFFVENPRRGKPGVYRRFKSGRVRKDVHFAKETRYRPRYDYGGGYERYVRKNFRRAMRVNARREFARAARGSLRKA